MDYLKLYRKIIYLRDLTDHTVKAYSTYIRSYLEYPQTILLKQPEDVSWDDLWDYIRWLQMEHSLSDLKPKAMVSLMYSAVLRGGEVCNLRYCNIERKTMQIHVTHSKNVLTGMPSFRRKH